MLLKPEPLFEAVETIWPEREAGRRRMVLLLGRRAGCSTKRRPGDWRRLDELLLICGRYEGVDERVAEHLADEEISIGDYVLSGGELARRGGDGCRGPVIAGRFGNEASALNESFSPVDNRGASLLDWPQYTRPAEFRGWSVPEVLLSGHHEVIRRWRMQAAAMRKCSGCGRI